MIGCSLRFRWGKSVSCRKERKVKEVRGVGITYNVRFGGTHMGWIGEMSVPVTLASGNSSAKSLGDRQRRAF